MAMTEFDTINFQIEKQKKRDLKMKAFSNGLFVSDVLKAFIDIYLETDFDPLNIKIKKPSLLTRLKQLFYGK
jgi:hypothetical protein